MAHCFRLETVSN